MKALQHPRSTHDDDTPAEEAPAEEPIDIIISLLEILEEGDS